MTVCDSMYCSVTNSTVVCTQCTSFNHQLCESPIEGNHMQYIYVGFGALTLPSCPMYLHLSTYIPAPIHSSSPHSFIHLPPPIASLFPFCAPPLPLSPSCPPRALPSFSPQDTVFEELLKRLSEEEQEEMGLQYYDSDVHKASSTLPCFARKVNTL